MDRHDDKFSGSRPRANGVSSGGITGTVLLRFALFRRRVFYGNESNSNEVNISTSPDEPTLSSELVISVNV